MNRLDAIKEFLQEKARPDIAPLLESLHEMEVQVNVGQDGGEKFYSETKEGYKWWGFRAPVRSPKGGSEHGDVWKPFRVPYNANKSPVYTDTELTYSTEHFEAIGLTGWNWVRRESQWVGFDFDSITGHSKGLTDQELIKIKEIVNGIPWITVRKSTSGRGLHLYVFLQPFIPTSTHTEHAALARAILGFISARCGAKLEASVDTCGGVLWVWHRRQAEEGYELIRQGTFLSDIPQNWQDHVPVISGQRKKQKPPVTDEEELDELTSKTKTVALDDDHRKLLGWLGSNQCLWWWDADRSMLVGHTADLARAHRELQFRGPFYTIAQGKESGADQNCFAFPIRGGGWILRRHTRRTSEHSCWQIDSGGWTRCYYNIVADLATAVRCHGGVERSDGWFEVSSLKQALAALKDLGAMDLATEESFAWLGGRPTTLKKHKDGRIIIAVGRSSTDPNPSEWASSKRGDKWERLVSITSENVEYDLPDEFIRHLVAGGSDAGWFIYTRGMWTSEGENNIKKAMIASGYKPGETTTVLGQCVLQPWHLVARPFQPEYPGNRLWNRRSPQYAVLASEGNWETWRKILDHCGAELGEACANSEWCKEFGITTGSDYLKLWLASLFQFPYEPLPYIFFYGNQNAGKSIFHEAASLLLREKLGYVRADIALTSSSRFNAELHNAVLCVIEEVNLQTAKDAYARMKDWVTSKTILIHEKGKTPYELPNTTHWIQCANEPDACPIFSGDTRITVIRVGSLAAPITKSALLSKLEGESAAFLWELLHTDIPPSTDRLRIPVIASAEKLEQEEMNANLVDAFFRRRTFECKGNAIPLQDIYDAFAGWLLPEQRRYWPYIRFTHHLPEQFLKGKYHGVLHIGNITIDPEMSGKAIGRRLIKVYDKLVEGPGD